MSALFDDSVAVEVLDAVEVRDDLVDAHHIAKFGVDVEQVPLDDARDAVARFADDVRGGRFPSSEETYHAADGVSDMIGVYGRVATDRSSEAEAGRQA